MKKKILRVDFRVIATRKHGPDYACVQPTLKQARATAKMLRAEADIKKCYVQKETLIRKTERVLDL